MRPLKEFQRETPNGIWKNTLFSVQSSPFSSYEWEDIHIQGVFGDIHVDVTDTVLPKGTSFISVDKVLGKSKSTCLMKFQCAFITRLCLVMHEFLKFTENG